MPTGLFSYNSQWIPEYSDRIKLMTTCKSVPLSQQAIKAPGSIKKMVEEAFVSGVDESIPFEGERDASEVLLAPTLTQNRRPLVVGPTGQCN